MPRLLRHAAVFFFCRYFHTICHILLLAFIFFFSLRCHCRDFLSIDCCQILLSLPLFFFFFHFLRHFAAIIIFFFFIFSLCRHYAYADIRRLMLPPDVAAEGHSIFARHFLRRHCLLRQSCATPPLLAPLFAACCRWLLFDDAITPLIAVTMSLSLPLFASVGR